MHFTKLKTVVIAALLSATVSSFTMPAYSADLIGFWDTQRKGGNSFNKTPPDGAPWESLQYYPLRDFWRDGKQMISA